MQNNCTKFAYGSKEMLKLCNFIITRDFRKPELKENVSFAIKTVRCILHRKTTFLLTINFIRLQNDFSCQIDSNLQQVLLIFFIFIVKDFLRLAGGYFDN